MNKDKYVVITWPDIQDLMEHDDFNDNACLITDDPFIQEYGSSAYFVRESWIDVLEQEMRDSLMDVNINDE